MIAELPTASHALKANSKALLMGLQHARKVREGSWRGRMVEANKHRRKSQPQYYRYVNAQQQHPPLLSNIEGADSQNNK